MKNLPRAIKIMYLGISVTLTCVTTGVAFAVEPAPYPYPTSSAAPSPGAGGSIDTNPFYGFNESIPMTGYVEPTPPSNAVVGFVNTLGYNGFYESCETSSPVGKPNLCGTTGELSSASCEASSCGYDAQTCSCVQCQNSSNLCATDYDCVTTGFVCSSPMPYSGESGQSACNKMCVPQ
jgi:hypothetical protein